MSYIKKNENISLIQHTSSHFMYTLPSTYSSVVSMLVVGVNSPCHALHISVEHKDVWYVHINKVHDIIGIHWRKFP